jgi:hypothetical protein
MPYQIVRVDKNKYYVVDIKGNRYSIAPMSLSKAKRQLIALHINVNHK